MNGNDIYEFEDRWYVPATTGAAETDQFITTLRETQQGNNIKIQEDTERLGTEVPSAQGGLISGASNPNSYFASRYQTPQVNSQVANLRMTAQANALNNLLKNDAAQWQKRYKDAYLAYQKRMNDKSNLPANNPDTPQTPPDVVEEVVEEVMTLTPPPNITLSRDPQKLLEEYIATHGSSTNGLYPALKDPYNIIDLKTGGVGGIK